ncbi:hypothetical protein SLS62_011058 [Diatrype stigma]|uniref:Uncharacterized protein n=1 Tax=Diatrype stigma TaxID=117547 RepID=A0AAN9YG90_9PEZI
MGEPQGPDGMFMSQQVSGSNTSQQLRRSGWSDRYLDELDLGVNEFTPFGTMLPPLGATLSLAQQAPLEGQQPPPVFQMSPSSMQLSPMQQQQQPAGFNMAQVSAHQQMQQQQAYGPAATLVPNYQYNMFMSGPPLGYDVFQGSTNAPMWPPQQRHSMAQEPMANYFSEPLSCGGSYMSPDMSQQNTLPTQGPYIPAPEQPKPLIDLSRIVMSKTLGHYVTLPPAEPGQNIKRGYYTIYGERQYGHVSDADYDQLHYYNGRDPEILPRTSNKPKTLAEMLQVDWRPTGDFVRDEIERDLVRGALLRKALNARGRAERKAQRAAAAAAAEAAAEAAATAALEPLSSPSGSGSGFGSGPGFQPGFGMGSNLDFGFGSVPALGFEPGFGPQLAPAPAPAPAPSAALAPSRKRQRQRHRQRQTAPPHGGAPLMAAQAYYLPPVPQEY